jgi:hypothetical protein
MATWEEFERDAAEMAAAGRLLLYQYGVGLGYLATVRRDGGLRIHPICPTLVGGRLFGLIGRSPKRHDLLRDGRFALHSFPCQDRDDEFYLAGRATLREDRQIVATIRASFRESGGSSSDDELLFELDIDRALLATYKPRGTPDNFPPHYTKWHAVAGRQ